MVPRPTSIRYSNYVGPQSWLLNSFDVFLNFPTEPKLMAKVMLTELQIISLRKPRGSQGTTGSDSTSGMVRLPTLAGPLCDDCLRVFQRNKLRCLYTGSDAYCLSESKAAKF